MDHLLSDLRLALRVLRRRPGFALTAIGTLAIGIGANTAIFAIVQAALLRPLPYADPGTLVAIAEDHRARQAAFTDMAPANFADLRTQVTSLAEAAVHGPAGMSLTGDTRAEYLTGRAVTANAFRLLGVPAQVGRTLLPEDDDPARPEVVLLSHALWTRRFGADPSIVGRPLQLDGRPHLIVGIMPPSFQLPGAVGEMWLPLRFDAGQWNVRSNHFLLGFGRLKPGATLARAQAEASALATRLEREHDENAGVGLTLTPLREAISGPLRPALLVLLVAVALLLLVAAANVTSLVLTRAIAQRRDLAVRAALGAGRGRLLRQQLIEEVMLALIGAALGLAICVGLLHLLEPLLPATLIASGIALDLPVLAFGLGLTLLTGLVCGSVPALVIFRRDLRTSLVGSATRSATASIDETRARAAFIAAQVALALVLLVGAGLLLASFVRVLDVDPGLRAERVLVVRFVTPPFLYGTQAQRLALHQRLLDGVRALPGIESAAVATFAPFTPPANSGSSWFTREGRPAPQPQELIANNRLVGTDYFPTLGVTLRAGRLLEARDHDPRAPLVMVVNDTMARRFWPGEPVVGLRMKFGLADSRKPWITIVGVVADVRQNGLAAPAKPEMYRPVAQDDQTWLAPQALVVKTTGDPATIGDPRSQMAAVRQVFEQVDRQIPIREMRPLAALVADSVAVRRLYLILVGLFAVAALLLATIGIYGVVAYTAAQRTREMGIRVALGAQRLDVVSLMLRQGLGPVVAGVAIGLALAAGVTRFLTSLLYEVEPTDALTFVAVPLLMLAAALAAAWLPARRAAAVDPTVALNVD